MRGNKRLEMLARYNKRFAGPSTDHRLTASETSINEAVKLMRSPELEAFELEKVSQKQIDRYGDDGYANLIPGMVLLVFPRPLLGTLGLPLPDNLFYAGILGAVLTGTVPLQRIIQAETLTCRFETTGRIVVDIIHGNSRSRSASHGGVITVGVR